MTTYARYLRDGRQPEAHMFLVLMLLALCWWLQVKVITAT